MNNKIKNVAIVSLSSGLLGEDFIQFETEIGFQRLKDLGLNVKCMPNSQKGIKYIGEHPEKRAEDLIEALRDPEIDMILTAIGGDDTYRLLPYLFDDNALADAVSDKVFLGFSDTTINHFMLHKVGLKTFYGQSFVSDICELSNDMLPYTKKYFEELIRTGGIREITPSDVWYEERKEFTAEQIGKPLVSNDNQGFELLQGPSLFFGEILGGCIDSLYDMFNGDRYADMPVICKKYGLFPDKDDWKGRIILFESSEEKPSPEVYGKTLEYLKNEGVFDSVSGVLAGKPMDETYAEDYKKLLVEIIDNPDLPIVFNVNIGHATPRCIIPFGVNAVVDAEKQVISFDRNESYRSNGDYE
ncbi:MAG: LD-carboxypeptidase [Eubacterium sp.]|nr:LD-carboxypeptidase [Eubacterium sp.]